MAVLIQNPVKCEVLAVIRFLHPKGETAAEIHRQFISIYGEDVMNRQNVAIWCCEFEAYAATGIWYGQARCIRVC
jgi:hypothetical protein